MITRRGVHFFELEHLGAVHVGVWVAYPTYQDYLGFLELMNDVEPLTRGTLPATHMAEAC